MINQYVGVNICWCDTMKHHALVVSKPDALLVLNSGVDLYFPIRSVSEEIQRISASLTVLEVAHLFLQHLHQRCFIPKPGVTDSSVSEMRATPGCRSTPQIPPLVAFRRRRPPERDKGRKAFWNRFPGLRLGSPRLARLTLGFGVKRLQRWDV